MTVAVRDAPNPVAVLRNELENMGGQFKAALPAHIPVERFARVVMTALQNNPELFECDRRSLWNAAMKAAQDGLFPDGREGAMVVRWDSKRGKTANWQPMIAGIRKKVRNSAEIATWDVHVVYANDEFDYELGDNPFIRHKPTLSIPGPIIAAYSVATLKSGEKSRDVMSISKAHEIRDRYSDAWKAFKAGKIKTTPWATAEDEMVKKTIARRHSKVLPMSTDLDELIRRDDDDNRGGGVPEAVRPSTLSGRLDALAHISGTPGGDNGEKGAEPETSGNNIDPETGEITDTNDTPSSTQAAPHPPGAPSNAPASGQGAPESHAEHVVTTGAPEAANEPNTAKAYIAVAETWIGYIEDEASADAAEKRWKSEKGLRNRLNVDPDARDRLAEKLGAKISALRNK